MPSEAECGPIKPTSGVNSLQECPQPNSGSVILPCRQYGGFGIPVETNGVANATRDYLNAAAGNDAGAGGSPEKKSPIFFRRYAIGNCVERRLASVLCDG